MNVRILRGNSNRYQVRLLAVALLAVLGLVAAGCGGSSGNSAPKGGVAGAQHSTGSVAVKTRKIKGLGVVLINTKGRTLYVFMKDAHRHVTCTNVFFQAEDGIRDRLAGNGRGAEVVRVRQLRFVAD